MNHGRPAALVLALLAIGLALGLPALQTKSSRAASGDVPGAAPAAATSAYEYMAELSDEIGPRVAGTPAERRAAERVSQWFAQLGYKPAVQDFTFKDGGGSRASANVVATKIGNSPKQIVIALTKTRSRRVSGPSTTPAASL
jgi:hypothetical protein